MSKIYIYKHTNLINGKVYIGQTKCEDLNRRWRNGKGYQTSSYFYYAIQKYGWDNFSHEVLEIVDSYEEANKKEEYYIKLYDSLNHEKGYNLRPGGHNSPLTEEQKQKISNSLKGRIFSPETKEKMRQANLGEKNPMFGKRMSEESKEKIRISLEEYWTPEKRKERSRKYSGKNNPNYGKKMSKESLIKASRAKTKYLIQCVETGEIFESMYEAYSFAKLKTGQSIWKVLQGLQQTAGGYHWIKLEKEIKNE